MPFLKRTEPTKQQPSPLQNWVIWAENKIASVITHEGLFVQVVNVIRGPMTITFVVRLVHPTPAALRKLLALGPTLAQALAVDGVRVSDSAAGIRIELPSPAPITPTVDFIIKHTTGVDVCLGMDESRQPVCVKLTDYPALAFIGPTRKGKTEGMKATLAALLTRNTNLGAIIVGRRQNWQQFTAFPNVLDLIGEHDVALAAAQWLNGELDRRNDAHAPHAAALVMMVDDLPYVLQSVPDIAGPLGNVAGAGGAVGLYVMVVTQFAGSKAGSGGAALEANILTKVLYRSATKQQAAMAAGKGGSGASDLTGAKGDAVLLADGQERRVATAWIPDKFWQGLPSVGQGGPGGTPQRYEVPWRQNGAQREADQGRSERPKNGHKTAQSEEERPLNGAERVKTPQNALERVQALPPTLPTVEAAEGGDLGERSTRSDRSGPTTDERIALRVEAFRHRIETAQPDGPLFSTKAPPSPAEAHAVKVLFKLVGSKEKLYPLVTGPKNGERQRWLAAALDEVNK